MRTLPSCATLGGSRDIRACIRHGDLNKAARIVNERYLVDSAILSPTGRTHGSLIVVASAVG